MSIALTIKRGVSTLTGAVLVLAGATAVTFAVGVQSASADTNPGPGPIQQPSSSVVTADALPTTQIDGVAWTQVVVGNTVYVGGSFANARPAGAAAGTNLTPRANMLAYNLTTGALITSFAPSLNGQVRGLAVSPDGTRLYAVGDFTTVNGAVHNRIAAFDLTNGGALLSTFNAGLDASTKAVIATNSTVYVGGLFANANGVSRTRLAAFTTAGALTGWNPTADYTVNALTFTPDGTRVVAGGAFANLDGTAAYGMGELDATTGAFIPTNLTSVIQDAGTQAAILSLTADANAIYGSGYVYGSGGNFEGSFSADPSTGNLNWMEDCHGDTYDVFASGSTLYTVSHAHFCANDNGWPVYNPWQMRHTVAFTTNATGTLLHNSQGGYADFYGEPSPSIINWFPDYTTGTYTGQNQAAWTVSGNSQYVVEGGEFPTVDGTAQQGLVRFAVRPIAPAKSGPMVTGSHFMPTLTPLASGTVRVAFQSNWDRDSKLLTYSVVRNSDTAHPVWTTTSESEWWNTPTIGFLDTGLTPGATYKYRIYVTDPDGNTVAGDTATVTVPLTGTQTAYDKQVIADGASSYWPLDEASGSTFVDNAGFNDMTVAGTVTRGTPGPVTGENGTTFDGSTATSSTQTPIAGPNTFTISAWVNTTSTSGGKIVGFGDSQTGLSGSYDRHLYMDNSGHIWFGVYPGTTATLTSSQAVNDGQWHQIVASLGPNGMALYIDGLPAGYRSDVTTGQAYNGYWRIGGDNLNGWPDQPSSSYFGGAIADVAIFPTVLTKQTVQSEYVASGRASNAPPTPTDSYGKAVYNDSPELYWRLDDTSGPTAADASGNNATGVYSGGVTYQVPSPVTGSNGTAVTFDGSSGTIGSSQQYSDPTVYSEEAWFNTTTTHGGKIIGFGNQQSGNSSSYDRHVYMLDNGQLVFGTWTGQENIAQTTNSYNDGQWHYMVATQGPDGMKLYVDGQLQATNPQTQAQSYTGYWRVGGDSDWGGDSPYFAGTIDEVAVYPYELTQAQVQTHYTASPVAPKLPPTASFTSTPSYLTASFDGTGSTDPSGTITSYAWNFGDGSTGTGATPSHTYAAAGTYAVTLTVTDSNNLTNSVTQNVTVVANQPPVASFTSSVSNLTASFDGSGSSDPDGTVVSYAWNFGDGSTGTGVTASHTYSTAGTYSVTLTVTDNGGATNSVSQNVTVTAPIQPPVASFTSSVSNLTASFDGSGSSDPDGTVVSYAWNFGDGSTGTGVTASHTYSTAGTYSVTLTVTDNGGATNSVSQNVTVTAPNQPPTASFTSTVANLSASFDGSASSDPDGTVVSYAWNFGDGTTGSGVKVTHAYAAAGTYSVTLTVTDNGGATAFVTNSVTVQGPTVYATDGFQRTVTNGFGTADVGGAWTLSGTASLFSVSAGSAQIKLAAAASGPSAFLNSVSAGDATGLVDVSFDTAPTGGGEYAYFALRHSGTSDYRAEVKVASTGVTLYLLKVVSGTQTVLVSKTISGLTYTVGSALRIRFSTVGSGTTTLSAKVWNAAATEPASWQLTTTDTTASLQAPGGVGLQAYLSNSATSIPVVTSFANLSVVGTTG